MGKGRYVAAAGGYMVPLETFKGWAKEDYDRELALWAADGPLVIYLCRDMYARLEMVTIGPNGATFAIDDTIPFQVVRYDHGERQRALGLDVYFYPPGKDRNDG